ncbi:class A beta-lactamase [Vibrio sagamiensis]|uniref:Beta-lactamase n=1 Tax=Vibrio sagamiensis NBRC 104589 TaxID=1219064 RepID=A0A511QCP9_9VIBR|nr:class A beta-lactamase [Vibrio sagamiensis]PNQ54484.1 class A beta-lactamase [Vibrio agarivorans]GEM75070.1 beta-lactamase [Vibrio sagamiensis NBRC 104589]
MKIPLALSVLSFFSSLVMSADLTASLTEIERESTGRIGVAVIDTKDNKLWNYHGHDFFPMMSTFKTLACAHMLYQVDRGQIKTAKSIPVTKDDLVNWNPVTEHFVGSTMTLQSLCNAAMTMSDNAAANLVLKAIGGPESLTAFLQRNGDKATRLDDIEPQLNYVDIGSKRNSTTPLTMMKTIEKLTLGSVLSEQSKRQLLLWMKANMVSDGLLRAVVPKDWQVADRSGGGVNGSRTYTGMIWRKNRDPIFIGIFVARTKYKTVPELNKLVRTISVAVLEEFL